MRADIFLWKKLPKGIRALSYEVPAALAKTARPGQLVLVPFRSSLSYGIISKVEPDSGLDSSLKSIEHFLGSEPLFTKDQLLGIETIASWYGISPSSACLLFAPPLQKRKLEQVSFKPFIKHTAVAEAPIYSYYSTPQEHASFLNKAISGSTLILVPEKSKVAEVISLLPPKIQEQVLVFHSALTKKEQFQVWLRVRNESNFIIVGTRSAVFLPFSNLNTIILDYEHDENHKHWDQTPRYHDKDIAGLLQKIYGASLHLTSFSPSAEAYFSVHKKYYQTLLPLHFRPMTGVTLINMGDERRAKNYSALSERLQSVLLEASGDVFLYINRRGFSQSVGCRDCGYIAACRACGIAKVYHEDDRTLRCHYCNTKESMIIECPRCHSTLVELRGAGTEQIEVDVRRLLGENKKHDIIRIDGDKEPFLENANKPIIIIGTDKAFAHIRWNKTDDIAFLDCDRQLSLPEYNASEQIFHTLQEVMYYKKPDALFFVQTSNPNHLVFRSFLEPDRWYRTELNMRRGLGYPPYSYFTRAFFGAQSAIVAKKEAERVYKDVQNLLTERKISATVLPPIEMHPPYFRKNFWYTIRVKLNQSTWQHDLSVLVEHIPPSWKIDPRPISILSP